MSKLRGTKEEDPVKGLKEVQSTWHLEHEGRMGRYRAGKFCGGCWVTATGSTPVQGHAVFSSNTVFMMSGLCLETYCVVTPELLLWLGAGPGLIIHSWVS